MYDNVYIKKSTVCNGIGIFAKKNIIKNTIITWYNGIIIDYKNIKYNKYIMEYNSVNEKKYIIGDSNIEQIKGKGFAQLANDAIHITLTNKTNNSYFIQKGRYIFLISSRNIKKNEEILVPYGINYWIKEIKNDIYNYKFKRIINILYYLIKLAEDYFLCNVYECKEIKDNCKIYFELITKKRWCINYNVWHYDENFYINFKKDQKENVTEFYYKCLTCKYMDLNILIDKSEINILDLNEVHVDNS